MFAIRQRFGGARMRERWRQGLWFLPLSAIFSVQVGVQQALLIIGGVAGFALVAFGVTTWLLSHSRLAIFSDTIVRTRGLGGSTSCERADVARVIEVPLIVTRLSPVTETFLLFLGPDDRALMRAYADYYPPEQLERFRSVLAVRWQHSPRSTIAATRRAFPGSLPWAWAHPWLTMLAIVVGPVVAWSMVVALLG